MRKIIVVLLIFVLCIAQVAVVAIPVQAAASNHNTTGKEPTKMTILQAEGGWGSTLQIGQRIRLWTQLRPTGAVSGIRWESSDPSVAVVDENGLVVALGIGTTQITAKTYNGVEGTFDISVPDELPPLQYERTADGTGYEIVGADPGVYTVYIPATYQELPVVSIRPGAFMNCAKLRYFTTDEAQKTFYTQDGVLFTNDPEKTLVCFPPAYDLTNCYYVPQDTVAVADYAFAGMQSLRTLTMQEGLQKLGNYAFANLQQNGISFYMPTSLKEIGVGIMAGDDRGVAIYAPDGAAILEYAWSNEIPAAAIWEDFQGDPTSVKLGAPATMTGSDLLPFEGKEVYYREGTDSHYLYSSGHIHKQIDLTELQKGHSGEVRVVLNDLWSLITPDPQGNTNLDFQPQTGLYGAGYTDGEAILRAYDRQGKLIAMQHISGDFAFSFPEACDLGVEGGSNTSFTVIPVEPVFIASTGTCNLSSWQWQEGMSGAQFRYFIIQLPDASVKQQMSMDLNLLSYTDNLNLKTDGYYMLRLGNSDPSRSEAMKALTLVFDALQCIYEDEHVKCMISSQITPAEIFGSRVSAVAQEVKKAMLGTYVPADLSVHQVLIDSKASWSSSTSQGNIELSENVITSFYMDTIVHEMVHAVDQNLPFIDIAPSPWMEGRAEYIGAALAGIEDSYDYFDWSFLTEEDKADFFHFYCYGTGRQTQYPVGYWFFRYLVETYGTEASVAISENIRNLESMAYDLDARKLQFKECVEKATKVGVFQDFVCEIINKAHTPVVEPGDPPTCTGGGISDYIECACCGKVLQVHEEVEATGHSYQPKMTKPTCSDEGYTTYTCITCGDSYVADQVPNLEHQDHNRDHRCDHGCGKADMGNHKDAADDNDHICNYCKSNEILEECADPAGDGNHTCDICGKTGATEHSNSQPTCDLPAICTECGEPTGVALDHDFATYTFNNDATCTADGTESSICTRCGKIDTRIAVGSAQDHERVVDAAKEPTCTQSGLTEGAHCKICMETLIKQTEIPAQGHLFGEWSTDTDGREIRRCQVCHKAEYRTTEKLPTELHIGSNVQIIALVAGVFGIGLCLGLILGKKRK